MKIYFQDFKNIFIKQKIKKVLTLALEESPVKYSGFCVNVALVDENEIRELNKKHRKIDKVTDVLSFPLLELKSGKNFDLKELSKEINPQNGLINLGDIVICKEVAKEQANNLGHSLKRELCFLALHGFLHLLGYDHIDEQSELEMNIFSENILNKNKVRRK